MNNHKILRGIMLSALVVCVAQPIVVRAETLTLGNLFNKMINGSDAPEQNAEEGAPSISLPSPPKRPAEPVLWASKAEFLAATRNGDLMGVGNVCYFPDTDECLQIGNSIEMILRNEYGVAFPFDNLKRTVKSSYGDNKTECARSVHEAIRLSLIMPPNAYSETLSKQPPDFYQEPSSSPFESLKSFMKHLRNDDNGKYVGNCGYQVLGVEKPHPYRTALFKLMGEYAQATKEYVEAERSRRQAVYAEEQAVLQAEQKARAEAEAQRLEKARLAEQQRINEERARVESERKKREAQQRNRVGG